MLSGMDLSEKHNIMWPHLYKIPRVLRSTKLHIQWWMPGAEGGAGALLFNEGRVPALQDEKVLGNGSGDDDTVLKMCSMLINRTLKM